MCEEKERTISSWLMWMGLRGPLYSKDCIDKGNSPSQGLELANASLLYIEML